MPLIKILDSNKRPYFIKLQDILAHSYYGYYPDRSYKSDYRGFLELTLTYNKYLCINFTDEEEMIRVSEKLNTLLTEKEIVELN